jgi:hypothetical protein
MLDRDCCDDILFCVCYVRTHASHPPQTKNINGAIVLILLGMSETGSGTLLSVGTDMTKAVKIIDRIAGTKFARANSRKA